MVLYGNTAGTIKTVTYLKPCCKSKYQVHIASYHPDPSFCTVLGSKRQNRFFQHMRREDHHWVLSKRVVHNVVRWKEAPLGAQRGASHTSRRNCKSEAGTG